MGEERIRTAIWQELPEPEDPFRAACCRCHGYDVYGELVGRARWSEFLLLLLTGERPAPEAAGLLEALAVALANPGPRDPSVRAAMNAAVSQAPPAAWLAAALAAGAGWEGGGGELRLALAWWWEAGTEGKAWRRLLAGPSAERPPGFDPHARRCPRTVRQALEALAACSPGPHLPWLREHRGLLEEAAGLPLALAGVAAAACRDLGLRPEQGELLHLLLRLPGAAVHALEQAGIGWRGYPFFTGAVRLRSPEGPR